MPFGYSSKGHFILERSMTKTIKHQLGEINIQDLELDDHVREYSTVWGREVLQTLYAIAQNEAQKTHFKGRDFYLVIQLLPMVAFEKPKFLLKKPRFSCPTPCYNDTVYKYHHSSAELEYLYHIPPRAKCAHIIKNANKYLENKESRQLAQFVIAAESGKLLEWVKKENEANGFKETDDNRIAMLKKEVQS